MKKQFELIRARAASKAVFNRTLALVAAIVWGIASLAFDAVKLEVFSAIWVGYFFISFGLTLLTTAGLLVVFRNRYERKPQLPLNITIAFIAGATKNLSVGLLLEIFGPVQDLLLGVRVIGGGLMGLAIFFVYAMLSANRANHLEAVGQLNNRRSELLALRAAAPKALAEANQNLLASTRDDLARQIETIGQLLSSATTENSSLLQVGREAVAELRNLVVNKVRPLSEQLRRSADAISLRENTEAIQTKSVLPSKVKLMQLIHLPSLAGVVFPFTVGVLFISSLETATLVSSIASVGYFLVFATARMLTAKLPPLKIRRAIFALVLVSSIASAVSVWLLAYILENSARLNATLIATAISGIAIPVIIATQRLYFLQQNKLERDLAKSNAKLAHELALFEQQLWLARRNWQFVVHGTVQAALTAAIARLVAAETRGQLEPYEIRLVREDLDRAIAALSTTPENKIDFTSAMQNLITTWGGVAQIELTLSARAKTALTSNQAAAICVVEICKEAVSNAVRHGAASKCEISLDRIADEIIELQIVNNGKPPKSASRAGYGSQMFDELTVRWSRERDRSGRTVLSAQVPLNYAQSLTLSR